MTWYHKHPIPVFAKDFKGFYGIRMPALQFIIPHHVDVEGLGRGAWCLCATSLEQIQLATHARSFSGVRQDRQLRGKCYKCVV